MTDPDKALAVAAETQVTTAIPLAPEIVRSLVLDGDLAQLSPDQRVAYYLHRCAELGIDPSEQPFRLLQLSGRLVLYAQKGCTDAICRNNGITREIIKREKIGDIFVVTARATDRTGRFDESTGAVPVGNLKSDNLANAYMKAETKAKRRAVISLCGIGILDESELDTVAGAATLAIDANVNDETTEQKRLEFARVEFGGKLRARRDEIKGAGRLYSDGAGDWKKLACAAAGLVEWPEQPTLENYTTAIRGLDTLTVDELWPMLELYEAPAPDGGELETGDDIDEIDPDEDRKTT